MTEHDIELAVQLRKPCMPVGKKSISDHLTSLYADVGIEGTVLSSDICRMISRIYIGDEFCAHRLPNLRELKAFVSLAQDHDLGVTLLTPVMTDSDTDRCEPLFDCLTSYDLNIEVVINDLGVGQWLKTVYPSLPISGGRLFDKGFKDPRIQSSLEKANTINPAGFSTFGQKAILDLLGELGVSRLERDVFPHGSTEFNTFSSMKNSVYFPFGYFTTGRVCWVSTFENSNKNNFVPNRHCGRPCEDIALELKNSEFSLPVIQSGNTLFYCYQPCTLIALVQKAAVEKFRLVYQGFAI